MKVGIFHTAFLGDLVLASLLIEGLFLEGHEVYLITKNPAKQIYKDDNRIKKIIAINKNRGLSKLKAVFNIAHTISSLELDVLLVPHKSITTSLIVLLSKVKHKIGYKDASLAFVYSQKQDFLEEKHECLRCLNIAPSWLITDQIKTKLLELSRPVLQINHNLEIFLKFNKTFFEDLKPFFIVCPGSVWATKKYPPHHFAKLIENILLQNKNLRCILSGSLQDQNDIQQVFRNFNNPELIDRIIDTSSYLPLNEFVNLVARAALVIANDSSPIHIASGANVPVVAIFGPTTWKFGFYPTSDKSVFLNYKDAQGNLLPCHPCSPHGSKECPQKHFKCMEDLSPDILLQSIKKLLPQLF